MKKQSRVLMSLVWLGAIGMFGLGLGLGMSNHTSAVDPQARSADKQAPAKGENAPKATAMDVVPPPPDVIDVVYEVAALRTIYLLYAWPDHTNGSWEGQTYQPWDHMQGLVRAVPSASKKKGKANVSDNYKRALIELRAAYITGQDDRIIDLTEKLEELAEDDDIEIDDAIQITPEARKNATVYLDRNLITPECIVNYLHSYGKDFPSPVNLISRVVRDQNRKAGDKIPDETRAFVIKEVGWAIGGFAKEAEVAKAIGELLDKVTPMSPEEVRKAFPSGSLRKEYEEKIRIATTTKGKDGKEIKEKHNPLTMLENLMLQDLAELFSNPRLLDAIDARVAYLNKASYNLKPKKE